MKNSLSKMNISKANLIILNNIFKSTLECSFEDVMLVNNDPEFIKSIDNPSFILMAMAISKNPSLIYELKSPNNKLWALALFNDFHLEVPLMLKEKITRLSRKIHGTEWAFNLVNKFDLSSILTFALTNTTYTRCQLIEKNCPNFKKQIQLLSLILSISKKENLSYFQEVDDLELSLCFEILNINYTNKYFMHNEKGNYYNFLPEERLKILLSDYNKKQFQLKILGLS